MTKPGIVVLTLMFLISLTACATFQQREKQLTAEYPEWSPEIINKVSRGLVDVGMTRGTGTAGSGHASALLYTRSGRKVELGERNGLYQGRQAGLGTGGSF